MRPTPIDLSDATVLVTGGARGIGRETARAFARRGARVAVCDRDAELAADVVATLGRGAAPFAVDVTSRDVFAACVESVEEQLGPIDVLVNNAGIMPAGAFLDEEDAMTDVMLDVNVRGPITGMRLVLPGMLSRGRGHVVNVASLAGKLQLPGLATYVASKHAVVGLGKAMRAELAGTGVTVSTVMPSAVNTELASGIPIPPVLARFMQVEPQDVAETIVGSVDNRRAELAVPRWLAAVPVVQPFIPAPLEDLLRRLGGDDRALTAVDHAGRAAYENRLADQARDAMPR